LIRVRWFAVALGLYLVSQSNTGPPPRASHAVITAAYGIVGSLGIANAIIALLAGRIRSVRAMQILGAAVFAFDAIVIFSVGWIYSYDPKGVTWVVIYILPLEGALRYRLEGAMLSVALALVSEVGREAYLAHRFAHPTLSGGAFVDRYPFLVANVALRVGVDGIIALVAGFMSRSLARQVERAREQAERYLEAARREAAARAELAAFNTAILTGVAAEDLDTSLRLMTAAIGRDLQFEAFTILLREGDDLVVKGRHGMPIYKGRIPVGTGITGTVAATGRSLVVADVAEFSGYIEVDPQMRSEMAAPMRIGENVVGVLDVASRTPNAFDDGATGLLTRLADQVALVVQGNLLLAQQRETVKRLQELDEMKSDFIAITSHELRTPITAIRGFAETLLHNHERLSGDQIANFMEIIHRQSGRLARLVEDLLLISRIEGGTVRLLKEPIDVAAFLREVVEAQGLEARERVVLLVDPDVGRVVIDPQRVEQILRNLIENALKFSPPGTAVEVGAGTAGTKLEVSVIDHGPGIPSDQQARIFDRFHQAGPALTREREGAGLGLYITKRLVEAMGGTISVRSEEGAGSTFTVTLPAEPEPSVSEAPPLSPERADQLS
jgi:signal transduction histidine kinase